MEHIAKKISKKISIWGILFFAVGITAPAYAGPAAMPFWGRSVAEVTYADAEEIVLDAIPGAMVRKIKLGFEKRLGLPYYKVDVRTAHGKGSVRVSAIDGSILPSKHQLRMMQAAPMRMHGSPFEREMPQRQLNEREMPRRPLNERLNERLRRQSETGRTQVVSVNELRGTISRAAKNHNIDEKLIHAVIQVESGWRPNAVSPKGATGLMQLMPSTAKMLGVRDSFDPEQNINGGTRYLAQLANKYKGNMELALAAYNAGPSRVDADGDTPEETTRYVRNVMALYNRYRKES